MALRWGLLSTARINDAFLGGVAESSSADVVAVASRNGERARAYAQARGIDSAHGSYEALFADPAVDAVYISLPNGMHLDWTERALRAGKHVLCEKPLGRDPAAVAAAFDLAEQQGVTLREAFMYRHHPQTVRLAELVADGAIGRLRAIRSNFSFVLSDPEDVRLSGDLEGGALLDLGCYCVSASRLLAGEPESVAGVRVVGGQDVDVSFAGAMRFPDEVIAAFDVSFRIADGSRLEVAGDAGVLRVDDPWHIHTPGIVLCDGNGERPIEIPSADSYRLEAEDLDAVVDGGASGGGLSRDDAIGQARALGMLDRAAR
ncbi:MAG TPA: Gfo/Idh/MocA family oxidoreductase [Solirubrobacteraceae bacterium]|jgi:predicted dehydrogenase